MLPAAFKKALQPVLDKGFILKRSVFDGCLEFYTMEEWKNTLKDVNKLNRFKKENVLFIRKLTAGLKNVELDATGRLLLPKDLMSFAGITKDVVLTATGTNMIEIWDKKKYEEVIDNPSTDFETLAEKVMGSLGNKSDDDRIS